MYFKETGKQNTEKTVELAVRTARERSISTIVVASRTGATARMLAHHPGLKVVCVTHVQGFAEPGKNEMAEATRRELEEAGIAVLTTTHVLSGAERALSKSFGGVYPVEIVSHTLRMFGQGLKVCVEVAVMALDAGLIEAVKPIIAIGGTTDGVDTAIIVVPAHASRILETRICEIICKPSLLP